MNLAWLRICIYNHRYRKQYCLMRTRFLNYWSYGRESQLKLPGIVTVPVFIKFVDFSNEKQQNCRKLYKNKIKILSLVYSIAKFGIPSLDTGSYIYNEYGSAIHGIWIRLQFMWIQNFTITKIFSRNSDIVFEIFPRERNPPPCSLHLSQVV
jgi:hypothetical protein